MFVTWKSKFKQSIGLVALVAIFGFALMSSAQAISRGYASDDPGLRAGMVVKLSQSGSAESPKIERATNEEPNRVLGVITTIDQSTVAVGSAGQSIYVETSGEVEAYVSDINGKINKGDLLAFSPLNGILAKHIDSSSNTFGLALEDFPDQPSEVHTIHTNDGDKETGLARIKINLDQKAVQNAGSPRPFLAKYGESIVGRQVSSVRVAVAITIFIIVLIAEGAILYGAISSAVSAIGRNPLARQYIKHELLKVIIVALFVLLFGLGAIYLVLWV
jgi:hypothetical protein